MGWGVEWVFSRFEGKRAGNEAGRGSEEKIGMGIAMVFFDDLGVNAS